MNEIDEIIKLISETPSLNTPDGHCFAVFSDGNAVAVAMKGNVTQLFNLVVYTAMGNEELKALFIAIGKYLSHTSPTNTNIN